MEGKKSPPRQRKPAEAGALRDDAIFCRTLAESLDRDEPLLEEVARGTRGFLT